jgi:hypothetical protein
MKKLLVLLLGMMPFAKSFSQSDGGKQNAFKINILSPVVRTGSVFYERKVSDKSSAQLGFAYTGYNREGIKITGVVVTPEYRFYLSNEKEAIEGFYVAPYLRYQNLKIEDEFDKATLNSFGGGLVAGHQWLFSDIVTLDIFLGPNYNSGKVKVTDGSGDVDVPGNFEGFGLRFGVTLGIAF